MAISSSRDETAAPLIAVIGSARIDRPDPRWDAAFELGSALGAQGWRVMTGGYGGLMEAAARGAHESGALVIGLPMREWNELTPNRWCGELRWAADYCERLRELLACDAVVALAGGVGTLTEAALIWSALQTEADAAHLVLLGAHWPRLLEAFTAELVIGPADLDLVHAVGDVEQTLRVLQELLHSAEAPTGSPRG